MEFHLQRASIENSTSTFDDEDAEIPDYEKKRLENIAEKKAMFEERLMNAKLALIAKRFKCSKCFSEFMKKASMYQMCSLQQVFQT